MTIWLASGNRHKQQELAAILAGSALRVPAEAGITDFDPAETGTSFAENALIKARALYRILRASRPVNGGAVLADDSGLCVDALGGRPGIYSARYYGKESWAGDGSFCVKPGASGKLTDEERNILLLEELNNVLAGREFAKKTPGQSGEELPDCGTAGLRGCRFVCAMALLFSPDRFYLVQETLEGEIISSAADIRGTGGFGYDPIVYLPELGRTVAELSEEEKNNLSHRGKAGRAIATLCARETAVALGS